MFIYSINDQGKNLSYKGIVYKTPCTIQVNLVKEIDIMNKILKDHKIRNFKVVNQNRKKYDSYMKQSSIGNDTSIKLSTNIKGRQGFKG